MKIVVPNKAASQLIRVGQAPFACVDKFYVADGMAFEFVFGMRMLVELKVEGGVISYRIAKKEPNPKWTEYSTHPRKLLDQFVRARLRVVSGDEVPGAHSIRERTLRGLNVMVLMPYKHESVQKLVKAQMDAAKERECVEALMMMMMMSKQ